MYALFLWCNVNSYSFNLEFIFFQIVYFTATVPVLLILVVLVKGVTLEGASTGIKYYLYPNMTRLQDAEVKKN